MRGIGRTIGIIALLWCVPACGSKDTKDGDKGGSGDPKGDLIQLVQAYQSYSSGAKGNGPPSAEACTC